MVSLRRLSSYRRFARAFLAVTCCALPPVMVGSVAHAYQYIAYATNSGSPAKWQARVSGMVLDVLWIDPADSILKRSQDLADKWTEGMQVWNNAPDALGMYDIATAVESITNLTGANVSTDGSASSGKIWAIEGDTKVEMVHDQDGSALSALGKRPVGGTTQVTYMEASGTIYDGYVIVTHTPTANEFLPAAAHELGHLLGIGHTAVAMYESIIDASLNEVDPPGVVEAVRPISRPLMSIEGVITPTPGQPITLSADDLAAISALYPGPTFSQNYGILSGIVTSCDSPAKPLSGVNVRAIDSANPRVVQIGSWTGYDGNGAGAFAMAVPKSGAYRLAMESLGVKKNVSGAKITCDTPGLRRNTPTIDRVPYEYLDKSRIELGCAEPLPGVAADARVASFKGPSGVVDDLDFKADQLGRGDAAFLIDNGGTMSNELSVDLRYGLKRLFDDWEATQTPFPTVALLLFRHSVDDLFISSDPVALRDFVDNFIHVHDPGDLCGRASNEALKVIGNIMDKGGTVVLMTDQRASASGPSVEEIAELYRAKGIAIRTILSGDCGVFESATGDENAVAMFSALAAETGGSLRAIEVEDSIDNLGWYWAGIYEAGDSAVQPVVAAMTPWRWGMQGDTVGTTTDIEVEVTGGNANFNVTSTLVFDNPDVFVNSVIVESPRRIRANLSLVRSLVPRPEVVATVTTDLGDGEVEVTSGPPFGNARLALSSEPVIAGVAPPRMTPGETRDVAIYGSGTNFAAGSTVDFGAGNTVNWLSVSDPLTAVANITADVAAPAGLRKITVTTGADTVTSADPVAFQLMRAPLALPRIASVSPASVARGQTVDLAVTGLNTGFVDGASFLDLVGEGVTVNGVTVTSATQATANVTVAIDAPLGFLDAIMVTGAEGALMLDAFDVTDGMVAAASSAVAVTQ